MYRKTYVEVNIDNLKNNVKNIVNYYNDYEYYFGVVKGNCYGHGTTYIINELIESGVNYLAVSTLEEALEARKINKKIKIMPGFIAHIGKSNIKFAEEKRQKLVVNSMKSEDFQIERRVVNKFMNDRLFADLEDYLIVVEGVVLNNHELEKQYNK